jgi:hypothetical protein
MPFCGVEWVQGYQPTLSLSSIIFSSTAAAAHNLRVSMGYTVQNTNCKQIISLYEGSQKLSGLDRILNGVDVYFSDS